MSDVVLKIENLKTQFQTEDGLIRAVDDVSFEIRRGQTLGVVGESGCGKSVTSLSIMRLIPTPPGKIISGRVEFEGKNLLDLSISEMRSIRGHKISMIFQEPMTSLNPVFTIGNQIMEAVKLHQKVSTHEARIRAVEMLKLVGIPSPEARMEDYPHQLSGGMRQRVMIAMSLSCNPAVLIADEPTTALDVTIQAQILDLLKSLQEKLGMSVLLITHDLGIVAEMANEVVVMYAGTIVERAAVLDLFEKPLHPYTQGLLKSTPNLLKKMDRLEPIPGLVPNLYELPQGCRFQDRCSLADADCKKAEPELRKIGDRWVRCIKC